MLEHAPAAEELRALLGGELYEVWTALCAGIDGLYDMDRTWGGGGKAWQYEYKYRRGGKTLCALYARERCLGLLLVLGKEERARFEAVRADSRPLSSRPMTPPPPTTTGNGCCSSPRARSFWRSCRSCWGSSAGPTKAGRQQIRIRKGCNRS